jgi:hypothetical protein
MCQLSLFFPRTPRFLACAAFAPSALNFRILTPPRESTPQSWQSSARSVQALGKGTFRGCHHRQPGAAIRLSRRRPVGRAFAPRSGTSCSTAKDRPPQPRRSWAAHSTRRTARNARGPYHAAGCDAATGFLRAWVDFATDPCTSNWNTDLAVRARGVHCVTP